MYQSLYETKFLSLREREGYTYAHMSRAEGGLVALLPYRVLDRRTEYLARYEICPAHQLSPDTYAITGGIIDQEAPLQAAQREIKEEAGYQVERADFLALGMVRPSKQLDTRAYLFAVDVTAREQRAITGDGSRWEQGASVRWLTYEEGLALVDPLFVTAMARLKGDYHGD